MSAITLGLTLLLALVSPSSAAALGRRQSGTVTSNCIQDFALTWDDGPYLWTDEIVDEFDCAGGKTTFFVNGNYESCIYSEDNVQRLRYAFEAGHQIASHTWSHADLSTLSQAQIDVEIQRLDEALVKILGVKPKVFRAPNESISSSVASYIQTTYGKTIVSADVDSGDANPGATSEQSYQFYSDLAAQGNHPHLALSHETMAHALDALDMGTINLLGNAGIKLVTVAQCLNISPYEVVGNYGVRDSSWTCDGDWSPSTPTCKQTYSATASDKTCTAIGAKFGLSGTDIALANRFLNCENIWAYTPVCIPEASASTSIPCVQTYQSASGDTCSTIAQKFGTTSEALYAANKFVSCNDIWSGTTLCIPAATTTPSVSCASTYTAQQGDTCNSIAHNYGVTSGAIQAANSFLNCSNIWQYTPICIPAGGSTPAITTTTTTTTPATSTSTSTSTTTPASTTSSSSGAAPTCVSTYTAQKGDTCASIGLTYGLSGDQIQTANSFVNCADIWAWTSICIPPGGSTSTSTSTSGSQACATRYTPTSSTTCDKVAALYGITASAVQTANNYVNCADIWSGTDLCIPTVGTQTSSTAAPAPSCVSTYTAGKGDTCTSIGNQYGLTETQIQNANSFLNCADIWQYTSICIPPGGSTRCTQTIYSSPSDTCDTIARDHGVSSSQIQTWNSFINCSNIWSGTPVCVSHS